MEIKSTAQATSAHKMLAFVSARDEVTCDSAIKDKFFRLKEDCKNDNHYGVLPVIPKETVIKADFGGDFGLYAIADISGVLHKVKIELGELHKIDFGDIPDDVIDQANEALERIRDQNTNISDEYYYD